MEKSSKRGKIPQSDWPSIMARYDAGETLASIARTYDCSPPAISYVVSRSRTRQSAAPPPGTSAGTSAGTTEPQLVKAAMPEMATDSARAFGLAIPAASPQPAPPAAAPGQLRITERPVVAPGARRDEPPPREANGFVRNGGGERHPGFPGLPPRATPPAQRPADLPSAVSDGNGDQRRTLHLSLGGAPNGNGTANAAEPQPEERPHNNGGGSDGFSRQAAADRLAPSTPAAPPRPAFAERTSGFSEAPSGAYRGPGNGGFGNGGAGNGNGGHAGDGQRRDAGGAFIDQELRTRVDGDIAAFLAAFDAALAADTQESRSALREATDRLLRAGARTRIELERLEARIPLPPRDNRERGAPEYRQR